MDYNMQDESRESLLAKREGSEHEDRSTPTSPSISNYRDLKSNLRQSRRMPSIVLLLVVTITLLIFLFVPDSFKALSGTVQHSSVHEYDTGFKWNDEEMALRNWTWGPFLPHSSLTSNLARLSSADLRMRNWIVEMRNMTPDGSVGLGRDYPLAHSRLLSPKLSRRRWFWNGKTHPESFHVGDHQKYEHLMEEWETGVQASVCEEGNWEEKYKKLHDGMMKGSIPPKLLTINCDARYGCGGLADRLFGVISTFLYAILDDRAISIRWQYPIPFSLAFDSPALIDWSFPFVPSLQAQHPIYGQPELIADASDVNTYNWFPYALDDLIPTLDWLPASKKWVRIVLNRGLVFRSFTYPEIKPRLEAIGLKHDTTFACLTRYLLRPRLPVLRYVNEYASFFNLPSIYSIGIHIRTGDRSMSDSEYDKLNTVDRHKAYFNCARAVGQRFAKPGQRVIYYLISDSNHLKADATRIYGDTVVMSSLGVTHVEIQSSIVSPGVGVMNNVAEMWSFAETDFKIITLSSGFGKLASWIKSKPNSTIPIFPQYNENVNLGQQPGYWQPNCSDDSSYSSQVQDFLTNEWSLG